MFRFLVLLLAIFVPPANAQAQIPDLAAFDTRNIITCPASMSDPEPPDFTADNCKRKPINDVDPQNTLIWIKTVVPLSAVHGPDGQPLSLYVSGKMSSEVYLNGTFIGRNGQPGKSHTEERAGKMDTELYPDQSLFRIGQNDIVLRASSHHGVLRLNQPVHLIGIGPAGRFSVGASARFAPALVTLGLFVLGGLYFGVIAIVERSKGRFALFSAMSFFAGGQLVSEALRGLVSYDYPTHDLRLIAIALFSSAFGLSVAYHILSNFMSRRVLPVIGALGVLCLVALYVVTGFDLKALTGMVIPLFASLVMTGVWAHQRRARAFVYFLALLAFLIGIFVFQGLFLDTVFFLLVAFFLLGLFIEQALALAEEARKRRGEEARANQLEQALAEAEERTETRYIQIKSAGKMDRIVTSQIVHCKGAGGYSEITLTGGRTLLHSATLNEMAETLPATFLRVHRSHLVNVMFVKSLRRDPSGTGTLSLTEGGDIPVSRRIMPKVRQALS